MNKVAIAVVAPPTGPIMERASLGKVSPLWRTEATRTWSDRLLGSVQTGVIDLGVHDLAAGKHKFTLEITGANAKAVKSYMTGLDYVKLEPVR